MKIIVLAEGDTERAFRDRLKKFLDQRCEDAGRPKVGLQVKPVNGRTALQAKQEMRSWVNDQRFHAHVARHDFEAWLLVAWDEILRRAGCGNKQPWGAQSRRD